MVKFADQGNLPSEKSMQYAKAVILSIWIVFAALPCVNLIWSIVILVKGAKSLEYSIIDLLFDDLSFMGLCILYFLMCIKLKQLRYLSKHSKKNKILK